MIEEGIKDRTYAETDDTTMQNLNVKILKGMNITMKCILKVMSQQKCMTWQKLTNLVVQITSN